MPSCAAKIEAAVDRFTGTEDIRVNYHRQVLTFRLDGHATAPAAIEAQVRTLGYGIAPIEALHVRPADPAGADGEPHPTRQAWWTGAKARLAAVIGGLAAAGYGVSIAVPALDAWALLPAALASTRPAPCISG